MKHYSCYLCGADEPREIDLQTWPDAYLALIDKSLNEQPRRLVTCGGCGFVQRDPKLTPEELGVLYERFRDHGLATETPDQYFDRITTLPSDKSENHSKLEWLAPKLREHFGSTGIRKALDIGCGGGVFLHAFGQRFRETELAGVEPTPVFAKLAARRLKANIVEGMFARGTFDTRFDAVFAIQVLEHVPDPVDFLRSIRDNLSANGVLFLEVPDVTDLGHLAPDHDRFMSQHLQIFSQASLTEVCRRAGLKLLHLDTMLTVRDKNNLLVLATVGDSAEGEWREPASKLLGLRARGAAVSS
jgi:SAM-dependent methyltransferase